MKRSLCYLIIISILIAVMGCSSSGTVPDPVVPAENELQASDENTHVMWGTWQFTADPDAGTLDVVPLRGMEMHLNALLFLEPPALLHLTLDALEFNGNIITADIGLRHPFLGLTEFSGFDVCGILISSGSVSGFADPEIVMAGADDTRLLNYDGLTRWWNPAEFPVNAGNINSYQDGLLGAPESIGNYNATINGYKYYCDDLANPDDPMSIIAPESRGLFLAGQKNVRRFVIELGTAGLVFNYAVDANWQFPDGNPPYAAPDDFPAEANRPESWNITTTELSNTLYNEAGENGGGLTLSIDVYDHFNADMNTVRVEAPSQVPTTESAVTVGGGNGYSTYEIDIPACTPSASGDLELLISVISEETGYGGLLPNKPVTAYFTYTTTVSDTAPTGGPWSEEYSVVATNGRFPVMAQTPSGLLVAAYATSPGMSSREFTLPDSWGSAVVVDASIDAIRNSIEPGLSGDEIIITTQNYGGTMNIAGVPTEYGHPLLYKWDGATSWDKWDTYFISNQLMHHTLVDFEGKYQWFFGTRSAYGHPVHMQFTNWKETVWYDYLNYFNPGFPNCSELGYSRAWGSDTGGDASMAYEFDRMKNPYQAPQDWRGIFIARQYLPSMSPSYAAFSVEQTANDHCDSPTLAVGPGDQHHIAYRREIDSTYEWQIVYRSSTNGESWSPANETLIWTGTTEPEWRYISIDVDSLDRIHVTWKVDGNVYYSRSDDDGANWSTDEWVNESIQDASGVDDLQQWMFVDEDDQVHVVWARIPTGGAEFGEIRHRWRTAND